MKVSRMLLVATVLCCTAGLLFAQRFYADPEAPLSGEPAEWVFARLAYDSEGRAYGTWTVDYPMAERHFIQAVRRLTRLESHATGHVLRPEAEELFDYPWLYVVEPWAWSLAPEQAANLRDYLLRGGFMMLDDFHGEYEWSLFLQGMRRIFPERTVEDIPEDDPIYQMPYVVGERQQVPGPNFMYTGMLYERPDGMTPHWRGIRDDEGRWMVVISHNIDYGEGWEQADNPQYPEAFTRQAYEVGIDYLIYGMTH